MEVIVMRNAVSVRIFNKMTDEIEFSNEFPFETLEIAKSFFNIIIDKLTNDMGYKKYPSIYSDNLIEFEDDDSYVQLALFE